MIPAWVLRLAMVLGAVLAVAAVVWLVVHGYETWRSSVYAEGDQAGAARVKAQWDEAERKRDAETLAKVADDNLESKRRMALQERNRVETDRQLRTARADAAAARAESLRMSEWADAQVALAAGANRGATDPASGQQCASAGAAAGMLAHVLKQLDERAGLLAEYADRARLAGLQCQRDYEALTLKPAVPQ